MAVFSGSGKGNANKSQLHPPFLDSHENGNRKEIYFSMDESISTTSSYSPSSVPRFIEHRVSKFDTLAGVAIKYGVEVADIKKMNGLVTDLQMFALKSIQIPLPGRHPPSPCMSLDEVTPRQSSVDEPSFRLLHFDFLDSFESSKASKKVPSIQRHHNTKTIGPTSFLEDLEKESSDEQPLTHHRKSRSFVNSMLEKMNGGSEGESLLRRRQKSEADFTVFAGDTRSKGKGLAQRPAAANRNLSTMDGNGGHAFVSEGETQNNGFCSVRKSSSTSNLQVQETVSLRGGPKWCLKPDFQAPSSKPIFDGLPKPLVGRKNKAALD